jgi:plasmid stabilization system protein ParE
MRANPPRRRAIAPIMAHRLAEQAAADLDNIWYYVAKESGGIEIASRLIDSFTDRFLLLARYPYLGRPRDDDFGIASRSFSLGEYVIVLLCRR